MRRSIPLVVATLALVAVAAAPAAAASPTAEAKAKAEHARIVRHWTAERIAAAKPRDVLKSANGALTYGRLEPRAKPKPPSGSNVTGASWPGGGVVVKRTGKVFFDLAGGSWVCSGTVITDTLTNHSVVLSAAHCLYDEAADVFATNWVFVPSYDSAPAGSCSQTTLGCWTAQRLVVHSGWADEESLTTEATKHDFGIAVVGPGGKTGTAQLDSAVGGGYPVSTSAISTGTRVHAFGYPASGRYKGKDLVYCAGGVFQDALAGNATWGIACNMTGGSSGGPWIKDFVNGTSGSITSLNSYGYQGLSNMYGPKFNSDTAAVLAAASASGGNVIVP